MAWFQKPRHLFSLNVRPVHVPIRVANRGVMRDSAGSKTNPAENEEGRNGDIRNTDLGKAGECRCR
jgi:hypothetical protein